MLLVRQQVRACTGTLSNQCPDAPSNVWERLNIREHLPPALPQASRHAPPQCSFNREDHMFSHPVCTGVAHSHGAQLNPHSFAVPYKLSLVPQIYILTARVQNLQHGMNLDVLRSYTPAIW